MTVYIDKKLYDQIVDPTYKESLRNFDNAVKDFDDEKENYSIMENYFIMRNFGFARPVMFICLIILGFVTFPHIYYPAAFYVIWFILDGGFDDMNVRTKSEEDLIKYMVAKRNFREHTIDLYKDEMDEDELEFARNFLSPDMMTEPL
jgi:hypothetical protein